MKGILILIGLLFFQQDEIQIVEIRKMFYSATESSKEANLFHNKMKEGDRSNPTIIGYRGMAEMVMAKHSYNPLAKLTCFKNGKVLLEKAIKLDNQNTELRFLRLSIQTNAPSFLGYNENTEEDKEMILKYFSDGNAVKEDWDLEQRMKAFVL